MAHSWVQMFDSEYEAFRSYAQIYPDDCTLLVDTYNVLKSGIPNAISTAIMSVSTNKYVILLLMNVVLLIVGTFLDITPACLIFTPIFLPIVTSLGMDLVQFGVVLTFNMCLGTMTPPVGSVLFVSCGISKLPIEKVIRTLLPYVGAQIILLLLVTYIPAISMALPTAMGLV